MNKDNVLREVGALIKEGRLTKKELFNVYHRAAGLDKDELSSKQSKISDILYFLGGAVVVLGICIFIYFCPANLIDIECHQQLKKKFRTL